MDHTFADAEASAELQMQRAALTRAVAQLPLREANIVRWHYIDGVPLKEIAARFRVSDPRVSQLHGRAIARLRALVSDPSCADAGASRAASCARLAPAERPSTPCC